MSELKYCNNKCRGLSSGKTCRGHKYLSTYEWTTGIRIKLSDKVMTDWINNHLSETWSIDSQFIGYARVKDEDGQRYDVFVEKTENFYKPRVQIVSVEGDV